MHSCLIILIFLINSYSAVNYLKIFVGFQEINDSALFFSEISEALMTPENIENFNNLTEIFICSSKNKTYDITKEIIISRKSITIT